MTVTTSAGSGRTSPTPEVDYRPGECNIGAAEIGRRRRAGHVGLVASLAAIGGLLAIGAPSWTRLVVALPASLAASGYIQAQLRFCAGFGSRGVFNFGPLGKTHEVHDPDALARDRARSRQIGLASLAIGAVVATAAALLPR